MRKRVLIADDEPSARRKLRKLLQAHDHLDVIGEASDGLEARAMIEKLQPDIAFLDIEMPELGGMALAQSLQIEHLQLVFVTAYDEFAVQAFDIQAVDYLLKPVSAKRLAQCIARLDNEQTPQNVDAQWADPGSKTQHEMIIQHGTAVRIVNVDHIACLESLEGYSRILLTGDGTKEHKQESLITDTSLTQCLARLPADQFLRVSRSAAINTDYVLRHWTDSRQMYVVLRDKPDHPIAVSRRNAAIVRRRWNSST